MTDATSLSLAPYIEQFNTGRQSGEPTIGVLNNGSILMSGIYANADLTQAYSATMRSDDGGNTWVDAGRVGAAPYGNVTNDPYVYVDKRANRGFVVDFADIANSVHTVSFSNDARNWQNFTASPLNDHENIFAARPKTSLPVGGYPSVLYMCGVGEGLGLLSSATACLKSVDGGKTWARIPGFVYQNDPNSSLIGDLGTPGQCGGATGPGFGDFAGNIYLPKGYCGVPMLAISKDEGKSWTRVKVSNLGMPVVNFRGQPQAIKDHEASVAVDAQGTIYYAWTAQDHRLHLAISRNGGVSFAPALDITPPGVNETWTAAIDVNQNIPGQIAISFMGTTNSPGGPFCVEATASGCVTAAGTPPQPDSAYANTTWNGYMVTTFNALAADPVFYAASVNDPGDPLVRGKCNDIGCSVELDFLDITYGPDGTIWGSFVDGCTPNPAEPCAYPFGVGVVGRLSRTP